MRRPSGAAFWVALESVVACGADRTAQVRSAISDITRRKQAEQEQRRLKEGLEQSQKMEAIGTLAGGIAHDVNNILAVILALGSRLERNLPKQDAPWQDARDIVSAVFRGKKLTQDLLDFARRGPHRRKACCPNDGIRRLAGVLRRPTSTRVRVELALDEDLPCVECGRDQLTQMLMSICLNSVDAIAEQGTIFITTAHVSPGNAELYVPPGLSGVPHVRIDVTDDGVGMDAETRRRAFEPFFTTKEVGEATGLGLSVVYGAVRELGGDVRIISRVDCGTTVRIVLPVCQTVGVRASSFPPGPENQAEGASV